MEEENGLHRGWYHLCISEPIEGLGTPVFLMCYGKFLGLAFFWLGVCIYVYVFAKCEKGHRPYPLSVDETLPL